MTTNKSHKFRRKTEVEFAAITVMSFIIIIEQMRDHNH